MFLNGTTDAYDPLANVAAAPRTMPHALLVSVPGAAHWLLSQTLNPGCLLAATTAFLQSGKPANPATWSRCTRALARQRLQFSVHERQLLPGSPAAERRASRPSGYGESSAQAHRHPERGQVAPG
jgi:hypothetical protein